LTYRLKQKRPRDGENKDDKVLTCHNNTENAFSPDSKCNSCYVRSAVPGPAVAVITAVLPNVVCSSPLLTTWHNRFRFNPAEAVVSAFRIRHAQSTADKTGESKGLQFFLANVWFRKQQ
jgi:hypothetical protein